MYLSIEHGQMHLQTNSVGKQGKFSVLDNF